MGNLQIFGLQFVLSTFVYALLMWGMRYHGWSTFRYTTHS